MELSENVSVRRATSAQEVKELIANKRAVQGFNPGELDHESIFAADETGCYIGELDGRPISCLSVMKYTNDYAFIGQFYVDEKYRGCGHGRKTWADALEMASLHNDCNIGLSALKSIESIYTRKGFKPSWNVQRVDMKASDVARSLNIVASKQPFNIVSASDVDLRDIINYDTSVYGISRKTFLEKWINARNSKTFVATESNGKVIGYVTARTSLRREDGIRLGPLFADNSSTARHLYKAAFDWIAAEESDVTVCIDIPFGEGTNSEAIKFADEIPHTPVLVCTRMYTRGAPSTASLKKIFVHTAVEIF